MYSYNMNIIANNGLQKKAGILDDVLLWPSRLMLPKMPDTRFVSPVSSRLKNIVTLESILNNPNLSFDDRRLYEDWLTDLRQRQGGIYNDVTFEATPKETPKKRGGKLKKVLKGTGVAAGVGALGYGGYKAYENYQARKKEGQEQIEALQKFMEEQAAVEDGENTLKSIGIGAGVGGIGGAGLGALLSRENRGRNAFLGGVGGAGLGALAGYLLRNKKLM